MSLFVKCFENQLMKSNCYIVADLVSKACVIIDPASEKSEREIDYIEGNGLHLDYIILTHEHSDHTWGANALKERFPCVRIVCSELCEKYARKSSKAYYDKKGYRYELLPADIIIHTDDDILQWHEHDIHFMMTPGHSYGSMCIDVEGMLFTGDTIMPFKPYFNGRDSKEEDWTTSIEKILNNYSRDTLLMPGHGDSFKLENWINIYYKTL